MDVMLILTAALVMSVLGLIFGALLGVTGRVFKVPANEKAEALRECLPGANCGACGYPGCDGYAAAVADGKAEVGACAVGGPALPFAWLRPWPARAMVTTASPRRNIRA